MIALFSVIIIVLINVSRNKGSEAGVKQNLLYARAHISTYYLDNGNSYSSACDDITIRRMIQSAAKVGNIIPNSAAYINTDVGDWDSEACHANATSWVISVPIPGSTSSAPRMWCIDSTNASRQITTNLDSNIMQCP